MNKQQAISLPTPALPATRIDAFVLMVVLAVLLVVLPYAVFQSVSFENDGVEVPIAYAILMFCGLRLSWIAAQGRPRLLLITLYSFLYVWVGLSGTAQIATGRWPWRIAHLPSDILPSLMTVIVFILCVELGYLSLNWRRTGTLPPPMFTRYSLFISDRAAAWLTVAAFAISAVAILIYGPSHLLVTRSQVDAHAAAVTGVKSLNLITEKLLRVPSLVAFNVIVYNGRSRWKLLDASRKRFYLLMGVLLFMLMYVCNYPPALTRHWLGVVLLTPLFALIPWRRLWAPFWVLALTAALTLVYPYLDLFRNANSLDEALNKLSVQETALEPLLSGHYDVWQMAVNSYVYVETHGPVMGSNLLGAAAFWFPRSLWPSKPEGTGYLVGKAVHYTFLNLSEPLWSEFYVSFGWLGLGILSLLYGRLMAWSERRYEYGIAGGGYQNLSRLLVPYWAASQIYIMRGDLLNATAFSSLAIGFFLLAALPSRIALPGVRAMSDRAARPR